MNRIPQNLNDDLDEIFALTCLKLSIKESSEDEFRDFWCKALLVAHQRDKHDDILLKEALDGYGDFLLKEVLPPDWLKENCHNPPA
jgi:hypothetical protein